MTTSPLPYFFDEAEIASRAKQPGTREKALNLSLGDLKWLQNVYLATQTARKNHNEPMLAHRLLVTQTGLADTPLAGAFALSRPNGREVTLYTPWKGLIKFADMDGLKSKLREWLALDDGKRELLRFLSIEQRGALSDGAAADISAVEIDGAVFEDQEGVLELNQQQNLQRMTDELLKTPTLQAMLDETLKNALFKPFPQLDQRLTRLTTYARTISPVDGSEYPHAQSSLSLSDALMHYYLTNQWPPGDSRVFTHPRHIVNAVADNPAWETAIKEIAQSFTPHLQSLIETFWNSSMSNGTARLDFFCEGMGDVYYAKLLLQHQSGVLTADEYVRLRIVGLPSVTDALLNVEKVRVTAPLKHYAELASTLMIGSQETPGFLYTPSRGVDTTGDLAAVKTIVLDMLKSEGHEDTLLNFMSLEERGTFLALPAQEREIKGVPVKGAVFEQLMADVLGKQLANFSYALNRYRESEGTLDPGALCDSALDVRGLIDVRLLTTDTGGRWSTRVDQRWSSRPATVRAESAKAQLTLLTTVEQALERRLEGRTAIAPTTGTVAEAQLVINPSLPGLQADVTHIMSAALRSELDLRALDRTLDASEQALIKTLLDSPQRPQRAALNGFFPDVFALALKTAESADILKLASCFVATERGGLDPAHSGRAVLWTPAQGFETFAGVNLLRAELDRRLQDENLRTLLLENLGRSERSPAKTYSLAPLQRIDSHFIESLQKPNVQLDRASVTAALATALPTKEKTSLLNLVSLRQPQTGLHRATSIADYLATPEKLPAWLATASFEDQVLHAELAQQYVNNVTEEQDFLSGVRTLARTAHHELQKQLKADTFDVDPDKVQITPRLLSAANEQTLTQFALSHFQDLDNASFTVKSLDARDVPKGMDQSYVKALIRKLKLGEHQQTALKAAFAGTATDAVDRRKRFAAQLPWQLMLHAHAEKLQERLSAAGFGLICQIMDMPDAIAREAVEGTNAIIRPLELGGIKSGSTIKVPGMWLVGPRQPASGRQILIAPLSPTHSIKEYENEDLLLAELNSKGRLQDWTLNRLPDADRSLYKARLSSVSITSRPVSLASNPIKGGLFRQLFDDNLALLGRLLGCQADTDTAQEWTAIRHVLDEDLGVASSFVMGKLAYPLTVWQSFRDLQQSAEDLQTHKWRAAFQGFISAVAQLARLRQAMDNPMATVSPVSEPTPEAASTAFAWKDADITASDRTRLQKLASTEVDLSALTHDTTLGLYTHGTTKKHFAPIAGKVFPVQKYNQQWRIDGGKARGPKVLQNLKKEWLFSKSATPPRFSLLNRLDTAAAVFADMYVDARGMEAIRLLYPVKARQIDEALDLATTYAWNAFRNLQLLKATDSKTTAVHQLIMDFIGVTAVEPAYVDKIEKTILEIFAALLDPTLRKAKSKRFVIGSVFHAVEHTFAFTVATDKKNRIYLAEKFFRPQYDHYRRHLTDTAFPISGHARAVTLIHELSHMVSGTEDIGYLDPSKPFFDLIDETTGKGRELRTVLAHISEKTLSIMTPYTQLFMHEEPDTGIWKELGDTFPEETDRAKAIILKLTGEENLAGARQKFKRDPLVRLSVQLANADSVASLIAQLGRQLHVDTP
ncbi:dermonecrotic toxin domain-containing protein [Pseudomonas sp. PB3P13]